MRSVVVHTDDASFLESAQAWLPGDPFPLLACDALERYSDLLGRPEQLPEVAVHTATWAVPRDGPQQLAQLRHALQSSLPSYMVPGRLQDVPALPLTVNGKLDTAQLLAIEPPAADPLAAEDEPGSCRAGACAGLG